MNKAYEHVTFLWAYIFKGLFVSILTWMDLCIWCGWICIWRWWCDVPFSIANLILKVIAAGMFGHNLRRTESHSISFWGKCNKKCNICNLREGRLKIRKNILKRILCRNWVI
jgi:hypothetical protein